MNGVTINRDREAVGATSMLVGGDDEQLRFCSVASELALIHSSGW